MKVYQRIAQIVSAYQNCVEKQNTEWMDRHAEALRKLAEDTLPRGSGFDCGTTVNLEDSEPNRLVLDTEYHHMDENGYYCGWTYHSVIVTPSLAFGFDIDIDTTSNDADIDDWELESWQDYAGETFQYVLDSELED